MAIVHKTNMSINDFVLGCWFMCDEGWSFNFSSDQWWTLKAVCERHGTFSLNTVGSADVEETLNELFEDILKVHRNA